MCSDGTTNRHTGTLLEVKEGTKIINKLWLSYNVYELGLSWANQAIRSSNCYISLGIPMVAIILASQPDDCRMVEKIFSFSAQLGLSKQRKLKLGFKGKPWGGPWWSSGEESTLQCRGRGFDPWLRNWDPTGRGATRPLCHNYWAPVPQQESPRDANYRAHAAWSPRATTRDRKPAHHN